MDISITVQVPLHVVAGVLCSGFKIATEWLRIDWDHSIAPKQMDPQVAEYDAHCSWPLGDGGVLAILDTEEENTPHTLGIGSIRAGLQVMAQEYPKHFADIMTGVFDSETGDVLLQCSIFGAVIYG